MQSIADFVLYVLVITLTITVFRMKNKMYMTYKKKELAGADVGAPLAEVFPRTEFTTIDGEKISLIDADTNKFTVLLVTSPGCESCKSLYPHINPFVQKHGDKYRVVSVMFGDVENIEPLRKTYNLTNPIVSVTLEGLREIKTDRFPFGYLLSPEGKVISRGLVGNGEDLELLRTWSPLTSQKKRFQRFSFIRKFADETKVAN
jgi:thiol-disulfide isomerase/thioredoxin